MLNKYVFKAENIKVLLKYIFSVTVSNSVSTIASSLPPGGLSLSFLPLNLIKIEPFLHACRTCITVYDLPINEGKPPTLLHSYLSHFSCFCIKNGGEKNLLILASSQGFRHE